MSRTRGIKPFLESLVYWMLSLAAGLLFALGLLLVSIAAIVPNTEELRNLELPHATLVVDDDNVYIGEFSVQKRHMVRFKAIPKMLIQAFVAAEDAKFFQHNGFDYEGIKRALRINLQHWRYLQGGSTITQQTAKTLLYSDKTMFRKIKEAVLAVRIEAVFSKTEILELYLNSIYFGRGLYGVKTAALGYFNKPLEGLTLGESAFIVAMVNAPGFFSINLDHPSFLNRRKYVVKRMRSERFIKAAQGNDANVHNINVSPSLNSRFSPELHHSVRRQIGKEYSQMKLYRHMPEADLVLHTSLNMAASRTIQRLIEKDANASSLAHSFLVVRRPANYLETFNSVAPSSRRLLVQGLNVEYAKLVYLLTNEHVVSASLKGSETQIGSTFMRNVLAFNGLSQLLKKKELRWQKIFHLGRESTSYLDDAFHWIDHRQADDLFSQTVGFLEIVATLLNKQTSSVSLIHSIRSSTVATTQQNRYKLPVANQVNCSPTYLAALRDYLHFEAMSALSRIPGDYEKDIPNLFIITSVKPINSSVLIYATVKRFYVLLSSASSYPAEEGQKMMDDIISRQIKLIKRAIRRH